MWWTYAVIAMGGRRRLCRGCLFLTKADIGCPLRRIESPAGSARHFIIIIVIRHETTAAARWALLLIVSTLFNDAITVAVWTGFHVCLSVDSFDEPNPPNQRNALGKHRQLSDVGQSGAMRSKMSGIRSKADITLTGWNVAY